MTNLSTGAPYVVWMPDKQEFVERYFQTTDDARHWVINHLDLSTRPEIVRYPSTRFYDLKAGVK